MTVDLGHTLIVTSAGIDAILAIAEHTPALDIACPETWQQDLLRITGLKHLQRRSPGEN